jgi:hypothetical protein
LQGLQGLGSQGVQGLQGTQGSTATLTQIGQTLYPQSSGEIAAGVTPTNYQYPVGNVKRYGAVGDSSTNDTTAVQNAINSVGASSEVYFPPGTYRVNNLTSNYFGQKLYGAGYASLMKNANGPIITISGNYNIIEGLRFYGDSAPPPTFTGHNLVIYGSNPRIINCGSQWAHQSALRANNDGVFVENSSSIWQTANTNSDAYDIDIGQTGISTLYHQLNNIVTGQSIGGIRFTDCGSQVVKGGIFGKYTVANSYPFVSGCNGGMLIGARVLANTIIGHSNAILIGNQFSTINVRFESWTAQCVLADNVYGNGAIVTNSGNKGNFILRDVGSGGDTIGKIRFGDDNSLAQINIDYGAGQFDFPYSSLQMYNNKSLRFYNVGNTNYGTISMTSGNNFTITNSNPTGALQLCTSSSQLIQLVQGGNVPWYLNSSGYFTGIPSTNTSQSASIIACTGTPESAITATSGSLALRTDGAGGSTLYLKESGTGSTGWKNIVANGTPQTYTTTWTGSTTNPVIGNGTLSAAYILQGKMCTATIQMTAGTTTTFGSGTWAFSLPFTAASSGWTTTLGSVLILDSPNQFYVGVSLVSPGGTTVSAYTHAATNSVGAAIPMAWGSADYIILTITYPIA